MITQQDSHVMTRLGESAKRDSGAMRTIAVVSMAFLPPTFLSVRKFLLPFFPLRFVVLPELKFRSSPGHLQHVLFRLLAAAGGWGGLERVRGDLDLFSLRGAVDVWDAGGVVLGREGGGVCAGRGEAGGGWFAWVG